jgi:hypothetical protein
MVINKLFGLGNKAPFRVPREASQLRIRIESENKENFPHLERYKEIARDAEAVYLILDKIIAGKEYGEEALKLQEDIKKKLAALADKIRNNISEAKREGSADYVEKNIDYLERKSMRNSAKDLFTEFLQTHELFMDCFQQVRSKPCDAIDSASSETLRILSDLNDNYFKRYTQDKEIQGLRESARMKVVDLGTVFEAHKERLEQLGLRARIEPKVMKLNEAAKELSAP